VATEVGEFIGKVALTPRRREPYAEPYDILRVVTQEDAREADHLRELGREVRNEARKLARDYRITGVQFIGCDVSLDGSYVEVKYEAEEKEVDLAPVRRASSAPTKSASTCGGSALSTGRGTPAAATPAACHCAARRGAARGTWGP
jgi:hypothetical protein